MQGTMLPTWICVVFAVIFQLQCSNAAAPVKTRTDFLNDELRDVAPISRQSDLLEHINQVVRETVTTALKDESGGMDGQTGSEKKKFKRLYNQMKKQLKNITSSVRNLVEEQKNFKEAFQDPQREISELKLEAKSMKTELETLHTSLNSSGQEMITAKSDMAAMKKLLHSSAQELQRLKLELTSVKTVLGSATKELQSTKQNSNDEPQELQTSRKEIPFPENVTQDDVSVCPAHFLVYKDRCYLFSSKPRYRPDADSYCTGFGANLISIESQSEQDFVIRELGALRVPHIHHFWLGCEYEKAAREWQWSDGSNFTYSNWVRGQTPAFIQLTRFDHYASMGNPAWISAYESAPWLSTTRITVKRGVICKMPITRSRE